MSASITACSKIITNFLLFPTWNFNHISFYGEYIILLLGLFHASCFLTMTESSCKSWVFYFSNIAFAYVKFCLHRKDAPFQMQSKALDPHCATQCYFLPTHF